jgi:hypothetical protein
VGTVCGKLLTMSAGFDLPEKPVVDSTAHKNGVLKTAIVPNGMKGIQNGRG